jgi:serine/threonine-protein kinase
MLVGQQIGPFIVDKELGSGAMGSVYLARYKTGQRVALKFLSPSLGANAGALARFEREADVLKQLKHPNIIRLFGHGKFKGSPYYAMEYVEGESLEQVLSRRVRLSWEEVVALGQQLCAALQHAHEQGIVHRDLKPSNLMVLPDGTLKLTDFGIAKDLDVTQLTSANCTVGTAAYMSPEQCRGDRNLSFKSDLYSLGVVFYELLTGHKPFVAENAMDMFLLHIEGTFARPSRLVMGLPIWLDTLVCQLLEKRPDQRPRDAAMVARTLSEVAEKVVSQQSAGVEAVQARAIDRRSDATRPDAEDKVAARTLMTGLGMPRRKRKKKPVYQRAWFQAIWIAAGLLALVILIVVGLWPRSADDLFDEASRAWNSGEPARREKAREGPIREYLRRFGDRTDEQSRQIHEWADEMDSNQLERTLLNRMRLPGNPPPDEPAEGTVRMAVRQEEAGEIDDADKSWQELLKSKIEAERRRAYLYGVLAEKRLSRLQGVKDRLKELQRKAEASRAGKEVKADSEFESLALEAVRLQLFRDFALASRRWKMLRLKSETDPEQRTWFLLAAWQTRDLQKQKIPSPADELDVRLNLIRGRLAEAGQLARTGQSAEALALCRDILVLYANNDDLKELTAQVRDLARQLIGN